jgi:uncharacterized protein (TIGR03118 family)
MNLTGIPVSAVEGLPFVHQDVATFTDTDPTVTSSSFLATIDWGDGSSSAGEITQDASHVFHVSGGHTYAEQGSFPIGVTIGFGNGQTISLGFFTQTPLVSNIPGRAPTTDALLVNPWGLDASPSGGGPWWISDNGSGNASLITGAGVVNSLAVSIPGGNPTGLVFNPFSTSNPTDFVVTSGTASGAAAFLFANESGEIDGWNPGVPPPPPSMAAQTAVTVPTAVFKGLAIGSTGGANYLYATDFHNGVVDVFDRTFTNVSGSTFAGKFTDPAIPAGFAPFGIQNIGGQLYVTYAKQDAAKHDDVRGPGNGFVDVFGLDGTFVKRLASQGTLNSPWGLTLAPSDFGIFSNDLLVGNFGSNGRINAFNPATGTFLGQVEDNTGGPIDGLWGLQFGKGGAGTAGPTNTLFFTAGLNDEADGLFGSLVAQTNTLAAMANVADAPLSSQGAPIVGTAGPLPLVAAPGDVLVATFTDAGGADPVADYAATISWGDGTSSAATRIVAGGSPKGVVFSVFGTHTYTDPGSYPVQVLITDEGGSQTLAATEADVVPNTSTRPVITDVTFDRLDGTVSVTFLDLGGPNNAGVGLKLSTLVDANNYSLSLLSSPFKHPHAPARFLVTSVTVTPGTNVGEQVAAIQFNNGHVIRGGHYLFKVFSVSPTNLTGVQDNGGNALDGEFYGTFPSGNGKAGGDFVAELDALHNTVFAPRTVIGPASPTNPSGTSASHTLSKAHSRQKTPNASTAVHHSSKHSTRVATRPASAKVFHPALLREKKSLTIRHK